jgi:hypothetical protein
MKTTISATPPRSYGNAYGFTIKIEGNQLPQPAHPQGYFSVTGEIYHKATRSRGHCGTRASGCIHDEILRAHPSLAFLVSMHCSDATTGAPSHAEENGFYRLAGACPEASHFGQEYHSGNSKRHFPVTPPPDKPWQDTEYRLPTADECLQSLAEHLRCTLEEAREIKARCLAAWNAAPVLPAGVDYPLNADEHRAAVRKAEKDGTATRQAAPRAVFAEAVATMRPRWAAEAAQAHRQIAAIKLRRAGEKVSEAITRANLAK